MAEQLEMDLFIPRPIDFIDCEEYCTNNECLECVLCDLYQGEHEAKIMASVNAYKNILNKIF